MFEPDSAACCLIDFSILFPVLDFTAFVAVLTAEEKSGLASLARLLNIPPSPWPAFKIFS